MAGQGRDADRYRAVVAEEGGGVRPARRRARGRLGVIDAGPFLAVVRLQKPHGLKGEAAVYVLTDDPVGVLVAGRSLTPVDESGHPVGEPIVVERSRPYHRHWLLKFHGIDDRNALERLGPFLLGAPRSELTPPREDQLYVHEIPGTEVVAGGRVIGVARGLFPVPGGALLQVEVDGREHLIPFRRPIVRSIERSARRIEVDPPPGLLEL